ncbi:TPA: IS1 family transposase [Citrobacter amalonaticus]|nr:IS1 family transposase [Citrobacter amalonaticus]
MATILVPCRFCGQTHCVRKHGSGYADYPRFRCLECRKSFQLEYAYEAHKPGTKEKIIDMAMNSSGVRDTVRTLKVGINTVIRTLKKVAPKQVTSRTVAYEDMALICEIDEQWSYIGNKKNRHWLRYAFDTKRKQVIAHVFGPRTDDWGSYDREVPAERHLTGKIFTQRIERHNLNLRTHIKRLARKTICYSRSFEVHEKLIGAYIEKHHYN